MADPLIFDANVLWSFAVVHRLDLLEARYGARIVWTDAVAFELRRRLHDEPSLQAVLDAQWLAEPIGFVAADQLAIARIRNILATPGDHPAKHLGEAEAIYLIENSMATATFVTDDGPAADLAQRRRIRVMGTVDIMRDCHAMAEIGCPDAWNLMREMERQGRTVRAPDHHSSVCP
jgi:predicted nucleic acid-binding protein